MEKVSVIYADQYMPYLKSCHRSWNSNWLEKMLEDGALPLLNSGKNEPINWMLPDRDSYHFIKLFLAGLFRHDYKQIIRDKLKNTQMKGYSAFITMTVSSDI